MSDPERLLDQGTDLEARLLASAVDEPPPPDLLGRTLSFVAAPPGLPSPSVGSAAGGTAKAGGLLGAIGIGAALGLFVVGAFELASLRAPPPAPAPSSKVPERVAPPPAPTATLAAPIVTATPALTPTPSAPRPLTIAAELALLDEARSALHRGDRAGARALLDRYAREIPRGQLGRGAALLRAKVDAGPEIDAGEAVP
jgi:hypothetical protein